MASGLKGRGATLASPERTSVSIAGRELTLTHLDKVMWPDCGYTKGDLISYYVRISPYLLPYLAGRPLTVTRYPDGISGPSFYQKNCPPGAPPWVRTYPVRSNRRVIAYILAEDVATLAWLANLGAIEMHPWLSRVERPNFPDVAVFDLDPAEGATFADVVEVAHLVRAALDWLGLQGYPKVSGATGVHIYVPIEPEYPYRVVSRFVGAVGALIVKADPAKATNERRVFRRTGRVYIDHLQNLPGKTIAAPFSLRPRPGAPVSVPVAWDDLAQIRPDRFHLGNIWEWLQARGDLMRPVLSLRQSLGPALARLGLSAPELSRR